MSNVFRVVGVNLENKNGSLYHRLQCLVSGDVHAVYAGQFKGDVEENDCYFCKNTNHDTTELGTVVSGVFLKVNETKATDLVIDEKVKPFNNLLTNAEKKQRSDDRVALQVTRRKGANNNVLSLMQSKYDALKTKFQDVATPDTEKVEIAKQMTAIKADATAKNLTLVA